LLSIKKVNSEAKGSASVLIRYNQGDEHLAFLHSKVSQWHANLCYIVPSGSGFQANKGN
jgi:hypothetical protein